MNALDTRAQGLATPAVFGEFEDGTLTVLGDGAGNGITVSRDTAGEIHVNDGNAPIDGGTPTVADTSLVKVFGRGGDDTLTLDETNGALPRADLYGGAGNDVLTGGSGDDRLHGGTGHDTLFGKGGADKLYGGRGNDVLVGGTGNDRMLGEAGDDRFVWNPGDGSDVVEGGTGIDTVEVNGGNGAETFTIAANGDRVRFDRVDPAPFSIDAGTTERLVVYANGGDDVVTAGNGLAPLIELTIDGGAGNDTITGGDGADRLLGGSGNDSIIGGRGNDRAWMGAGDDVFTWNPGDGSDVIRGQAGLDTMRFNGANANENIDIAADGARVRFFRDVGAVTMDLDDVERIDFAALGGADAIVVGDLSGTDTKQVDIDLAGTLGGSDGDAQADSVTVRGGKAGETVDVTGSAGSVSVTGLAATVSMSHVEAGDSLVVKTYGGHDSVNASTLAAGIVGLTIDTGAGNDTVIGSQGADRFAGGSGDDVVTGGRGNDVGLMGSGDDTFVWNPGDGSDTVEGQGGTDTLRFNGANAGENIDISANGNRETFFRDVGSVTMDLNDVERTEFNALGGADSVVVHDLGGTDAKVIGIDLAGTLGGTTGDGQADRVTVEGTGSDDAITITSADGTMSVKGLAAQVDIDHFEASLDTLVVHGLAGDDVIDASNLAAGSMPIVLDGGAGNDVLMGGAGDDVLDGGDGNDVLVGGAGDDVFVGGEATIRDFEAGPGAGDTIDLRALGASVDFSGLIADAQEGQGSVVLDLGNGQNLTLEGVELDELQADDFLFAPAEAAGASTTGTEGVLA